MENQDGKSSSALKAARQSLIQFLTLLSVPNIGKAPVLPIKKSQLAEHGNQSLANQAAQRRAENNGKLI